ncbi:MAG: hypothetical protein ACR2RB_22420 [Gammaproteobacteria bacterium]
MERSLDGLISEYLHAKAEELRVRSQRLELEEEILEHEETVAALAHTSTVHLPIIGSPNQLTIRTGLNRKWDQGQLASAVKTIEPQYWPFKTEWKEDRAATRLIEERWPDLWTELLMPALTLTPKKPAFTVNG